jgi:hypothetical protein
MNNATGDKAFGQESAPLNGKKEEKQSVTLLALNVSEVFGCRSCLFFPLLYSG